MTAQIPLVDYLALDDVPHLVANECVRCGARYFDRRNGCASCEATEFRKVPIDTTGTVRGGTTVRGNLVNVPPDAEHVHVGMKVRLTTTTVGTDGKGTEAVGFGFEPLEGSM